MLRTIKGRLTVSVIGIVVASILLTTVASFRACLKNAFCQMCVTICGRFAPNEGHIAGYVT